MTTIVVVRRQKVNYLTFYSHRHVKHCVMCKIQSVSGICEYLSRTLSTETILCCDRWMCSRINTKGASSC